MIFLAMQRSGSKALALHTTEIKRDNGTLTLLAQKDCSEGGVEITGGVAEVEDIEGEGEEGEAVGEEGEEVVDEAMAGGDGTTAGREPNREMIDFSVFLVS